MEQWRNSQRGQLNSLQFNSQSLLQRWKQKRWSWMRWVSLFLRGFIPAKSTLSFPSQISRRKWSWLASIPLLLINEKIKKVKLSGLLGLVFSFVCGALAGSPAYNPQPKDKPKPLNESNEASSNHKTPNSMALNWIWCVLLVSCWPREIKNIL